MLDKEVSMKIRVELIDLYIKRMGLSTKEFCDRCNITKQTLQRIMRNDYKYQTAAVLRIAEAIGIEVCDLYTKD